MIPFFWMIKIIYNKEIKEKDFDLSLSSESRAQEEREEIVRQGLIPLTKISPNGQWCESNGLRA